MTAYASVVAAVGQTAFAGEINVIMEEVPDYDIVAKLTEEFTAANPDITVNFDAMPFDAMRDKILTSSLAPSASYDVIIIDNPWTEEFANAGYLEPLDDYIAATEGYDYEDFVPSLAAISSVGGSIYGVPYYNYALGLIVRQDIFDEKGLEIPTTIQDYMSTVASLTTDDFYGAAMQPQKGYKVMEEWKNWLYANGGELFDENGNVIINNPAAVTALEQYIETFNAAAPPNSANWGFDEALRAVSSGKAATMLSYNWMLPALNAEGGMAGDLAGNFTLHEVPGGKAVLGLWSWGITANSENKDDAWKFVSWISSPEVAKRRVSMGGAPVRTSVLNDPEVWEQGFGEAYYKALAGILEDAAPLSTGGNAEELIEIVGTELSAAVNGQKGVQEALDDAARGVERANR
ncbi:ABC transporter substrate-binding protein [Oceanibium sediminis]|uniref:ABC transporter substrate-binding protein n=1 Tax=Oceanibium sediminis TaxID=2026339 RepID=UPI0018E5747F|nr:sugar ABC transporter substrate-binding protein [Oceanibium sediminis]